MGEANVTGLLKCAVVVITWFGLMMQAALAHHVMGGELPATLLTGFVSGLGHPIIGLDHLAAMVAIGVLASPYRAGGFLVIGYILAMFAGAALHVRGGSMPGAEILVAASVLGLGAVLLGRLRIEANLLCMLFALVGWLHGYALGESIVGAQPAPLVAYFAGLGIIQFVVAVAALLATRFVVESRGEAVPLRLAGFAIAGVGIVFLAQQLAL